MIQFQRRHVISLFIATVFSSKSRRQWCMLSEAHLFNAQLDGLFNHQRSAVATTMGTQFCMYMTVHKSATILAIANELSFIFHVHSITLFALTRSEPLSIICTLLIYLISISIDISSLYMYYYLRFIIPIMRMFRYPDIYHV